MKNDQSSDFQTSIGATVHATLDTEQLISDTRAALVDTVASLQGSDRRISVSKVHEILTKICDILDSVMSKQIENTAHILAFLF